MPFPFQDLIIYFSYTISIQIQFPIFQKKDISFQVILEIDQIFF